MREAELYEQGCTPMQIGRVLKKDKYSILQELYKQNVTFRRLHLTESGHARLRAMLESGADYREIAKSLHISCEVAKLVKGGHPY